MKLKKMAAATALLAMSAVALAGCGKKSDDEKVVILYPGEESERMEELLADTINPRLKEEAGIQVEMVYVPWDQYWEQKDIMLAAKEDVDLYWDGLPDLSTMVNKKQCQPLDELIDEYCPDLKKVIPQSQLDGGKIGDKTYAIPSAYAPSSAMYQEVCVREDMLENVGMDNIETPEDLKEFATKVKEQYPEMKGPADIIFKPLTRYYQEEPYTWIAFSDSVVYGEDTKKAYDYYETTAFQEVAKFNRSMYEAGLYKDELTTNYNERDSRMQQGLYLWVEGSLGKSNEIIDTVKANAPEAKLKDYLLAPEKDKYIVATGGEALCVPYSAKNPAGAMKFLNWLYSSQENYLLALYGEEGTDYEMVDGKINVLSANDFFYEWMFRNQNYQVFPVGTSDEYNEEYKHWDDDAKQSDMIAFHFDNSKVADIETAINEVMQSDLLSVECGFVDFEENYDNAIQKLKDAGIDEYVAEVQRQVDEYLANRDQ